MRLLHIHLFKRLLKHEDTEQYRFEVIAYCSESEGKELQNKLTEFVNKK